MISEKVTCCHCDKNIPMTAKFCGFCGGAVAKISIPSDSVNSPSQANTTTSRQNNNIASSTANGAVHRTSDSQDSLMSCPFCGEQIKTSAIKCRFCQSFLSSSSSPPVGQWRREQISYKDPPLQYSPTTNSEVDAEFSDFLLMGTPIVATLLTYFWVGNMSLFQAPMSKIGLISALLVLITTGIVYLESSALRIGKIKSSDGRMESPPSRWAISLLLLWAVAFPYYCYRRSKYGAKNLFLGALFFETVYFICVKLVTARFSTIYEEVTGTIQKLFM